MLIDKITTFCDKEYKSQDITHICTDCNHPHKCSGSCKKCLEEVHFPSTYTNGKRDYDCSNLVNFYVCDYSFKYSSEILYLLEQSQALKEIQDYHIMSIGCGACPDLMAFEEYVKSTAPHKIVQYYGIDKNPLWKPVHIEVENYLQYSTVKMTAKFVYEDAIEYFKNTKIPSVNVIVIQYLISHLYNTNQIEKINEFYEDLISNIIMHRDTNTPLVILINDVNSCYRGRNYFEDLCNQLAANDLDNTYAKFYFDYNIQSEFQRYGLKHESTNILFNIPDGFDIYQPWEQCSSAQLLIEVGRRDNS